MTGTTPEQDAAIARTLGLRNGDPALHPGMLLAAIDANEIVERLWARWHGLETGDD